MFVIVMFLSGFFKNIPADSLRQSSGTERATPTFVRFRQAKIDFQVVGSAFHVKNRSGVDVRVVQKVNVRPIVQQQQDAGDH